MRYNSDILLGGTSSLDSQILLIATIAATLGYAFLNGMHDAGGLVATAISSRSLSPQTALALASLAEFAGPFLFGTAVATTIGHDLIEFSAITLGTLLIAMVSAIVWNIFTWYVGMPSSSTHALLGGLIGAVIVEHGYQALLIGGLAKVLISLFIAPVLGLIFGYLFMKNGTFWTRNASPRISIVFKRAQLLNVVALALSHGTNDGQKSMGLIALALEANRGSSEFVIPLWVTLLCAAALTLGVRAAGWRIIRTIGSRIYRLRPIHASAAQSASAVIVLGAALLGGPVSTSQVVSGAIIGVGSAERLSGVRWEVAGQILIAWLTTIPATVLLAAILQKIFLIWQG